MTPETKTKTERHKMSSKKYSSMIGNLTVRSNNRYIVYGSVRGLVSEHRTQSGAERSAEADRRACKNLPGGNSYSDVSVYCYDEDNGWETVEETSSY